MNRGTTIAINVTQKLEGLFSRLIVLWILLIFKNMGFRFIFALFFELFRSSFWLFKPNHGLVSRLEFFIKILEYLPCRHSIAILLIQILHHSQ